MRGNTQLEIFIKKSNMSNAHTTQYYFEINLSTVHMLRITRLFEHQNV
jgi:hypothetical protein